MADSFAEQLRSELDGIETQLARLAAKRRLVEELLSLESGAAPSSAPAAKRTRRTGTAATKRPRLPRGQITNKIREFLGQQRAPAHATAILAYLEEQDSAPRSAKPMATLQSNLQRLKEQGELENTGRNHWRLRPAETAPPAPAAPRAAAPASPSSEAAAAPATPLPTASPPVVRSTTTFGRRPGAGA
ncbi:MAG: hypothetical protein F4Y29_11060 [Chloroflexi bacterium]|nr:hypothetical protein [Chloroflexota bacterium]MYJ02000.1 hypothetical protein [Chloroflexota bacterium]